MDTDYRAVDTTVGQQLDVLVDYSRRMLVAAKENAWDEVADIESKRRIAMERFFDGKNEKTLPVDVLRSGLMELQVLERELVTLGMAAKEAMSEEIRGINQSQKAVAAYRSNK